MRLLVCFLLLQLSFIEACFCDSLTLHFINYSNRECVLTNLVRDATLFNTELDDYVKDIRAPIVLQPKKRFLGYLYFSKKTLKDNELFLIEIGDDIFKLCFSHKCGTMPYLCDGGKLEEATLFTSYKGVELDRRRRYIIQGDAYRVTQMEDDGVRFLFINNKDKALEGDPTVPCFNDDEEQIRYEREFGDTYGKTPKPRHVLEWSDPVLPTEDPGLPEQGSNCCVIL